MRTLLFILLFINSAWSRTEVDTQTELKRYYRCYSHMVRERVEDNDPRVQKIKTGKLSGTEACLEVFDFAKLSDRSGLLQNKKDLPSNDLEAYRKTLYSVTRNRCSNCHGDTSPTVRRHSASNPTVSYNVIRNYHFVNFDQISKSKIVQKVANGHNCWSNCEDNAAEISKAIDTWKSYKIGLENPQVFSPAHGFNTVGQKVLKTFNDFHRSWFDSYSISAQETGFCASGTNDVVDSGSMAYYVTNAMFGGKEFRSIVTSDDQLKAVRYNRFGRSKRLMTNLNSTRKLIIGAAKRDSSGDLLPRESRYQVWNDVPLAEQGEILGLSTKNPYFVETNYNQSKAMENGFNLFDNRGAGLLATNSYLLLNAGQPQARKSDGALHVMRRWSRAMFNDLFCRDVPVIRNTDAIKYVDTSGKSPLAYRAGISCMQCHATMDQLAMVSRGVTFNRSAPSCNGSEGHAVSLVHNTTPDMGENAKAFNGWIDNADSNFYRREQNGLFLYRTTDGDLVDEKFQGFDELGEVIADQDDLYRCAVKRYVHFFTGVDVPLFDVGDINAPVLESGDKEYLRFVRRLATKLKSEQDLREVVREIFQSNAYVNHGQKVN